LKDVNAPVARLCNVDSGGTPRTAPPIEPVGGVLPDAARCPRARDPTKYLHLQLAGKVVVDITNPLNFATFDSLTVPADSSAAAEIAAALPQSRVLKAFNTNFAATLAAGTVGALPTTVLIVGDDADAKALLVGVVTAGGLHAIDAGALSRARELEAVGFLQLTLAVGEKISWTGGFGVVA
jgi:predicted dinucleotide-binding enzyme